jgi:biotin transport system permease protein
MGLIAAPLKTSGTAARPLRGSDRIEQADPRLKVLCTMALGLAAMRAHPLGLAIFGACMALVLIRLISNKPQNGALLKSYLIFVLVWMLIKFGLDLWGGIPWSSALIQAGELGLKLSVLLILGLGLALSTSARALGLGLAAMLRPLLRSRAWQVALAIALMIHFIPLTWQSIAAVQAAFRIRGLRLGWPKRVRYFTQAILRHWSQKAWRQTMALASRGLDDPKAWNVPLPFKPLEWLLGVGITTLGLGCLAL